MDLPLTPVAPLFLGTYSPESAMYEIRYGGSVSNTGALTWPSANLAVYMPVSFPYAYPVRRVWWLNGTTVTSSNLDFGIYNVDGTRLYSTGSTALSGTSQPQYVTPTEFVLSPGAYYFAIVLDTTSANRLLGSSTTVTFMQMGGVLQEALGSTALPATMTPAAIATAVYPLCGVTQTASGF